MTERSLVWRCVNTIINTEKLTGPTSVGPLVSLNLFNIPVCSCWSWLGLDSGREMDSHRKDSDTSGSVSVLVLFSVFPLSILSWLRILSSASSTSHLDSSAFQGLWQPVRHSENPPLMFQCLAAWLHNFPASMARGAKALNCRLEILSGSLKKKSVLVQDCATRCIFNSWLIRGCDSACKKISPTLIHP